MTFFYDINKRLASIADKPQTQQLNERDMSRAAKGYEKYGKEGMEALAKAGQDGASEVTMDRIRAKHNKYKKSNTNEEYGPLEELTSAPMSAAMRRKLGLGEEGGVPMTAKQKSFAKLAPPEDKITFADKIAGAKKEVDEMLGDVAAEAMKGALKGGQKKLDRNHNGKLDAEDFAMLRAGKGKQETDETRNRDLEDYYGFNEPKSSTKGQVHRGTYGTEYQGEPDEDDDIGQKKVKKAKSAVPSGEKRGRGRPSVGAGKGKKIGAKGPGVKSKLLTKEADHDSDEVKQAMAVLKKAGYKISKGEEELEEKAVSQQQQKFMGMAHAMQKGEKIKGASAELKKVARTMKPKDVEDFAATKHKGLPKKKTKAKEEVEETTTSGSVATAPEAPKSKGKGGMTFGKGIYDSMNRELEAMIAESMNIDMHMGQDDNGQPNKSLTVTATDEDAIYLGKLLKMAGVGSDTGQGCGSAEQVDENQPDWPTETETSNDALQYSGGLNKPKTTVAGDGQTTVPVTAVQVREGEDQGVAEGTAVPWQVVINALASGYPDSDPTDSLAPIMRKYGVDFDDLNLLAQQNGYDDIYAVLDEFGEDQGVAEDSLDEQEQVMAPESKELELDEELQRIREMAGIREAAKPDYIDLDRDGNRKESMKKAGADAENDKKVEESILDMTRLWQAYKA